MCPSVGTLNEAHILTPKYWKTLGAGGPNPPVKSQIAIFFLRNTGRDPEANGPEFFY